MKRLLFLSIILLFAFIPPEKDHKTQYLASSMAVALLVESIYNVPIQLTLAQSAHESGWGNSYNARYRCNYFGITNRNGDYVVYNSKEESFRYYGKLMSRRYEECLVDNARESIQCIHKKGYAEDLDYTLKLIKIFRQISRMV